MVGVECPPKSGDSEKLDSSPSGTPTTRPPKNSKDGTLNERRTAVGNAEVRRSVPEFRQNEGPQVGDDMDIRETDDDETEADNDNYDDAGNGSAQWSIFAKRKPHRKVKPEQLRLERSIKVTVRDDEHAERLAALTRLAEKTCGRVRSYEVSIERTPAQKVGSSRGVIKVRPGQTIEYIIDHLRCETAKIIDARLLGKTNMLLLTFDTESPPSRLVFDYEITKVHEYRPKVIACYNCHGLGHIAKYFPSEEVCKQCGRKHSEDSECDDDLFCVACQKEGHISLNSACPSRVPKDIKKMSQNAQGPERTVSWPERVRAGTPKQHVLSSDYEQQIEDLRKENQQLRAMLQEILARLPPDQRSTQPGTPVRQHEPTPPANATARTRSVSRVG
ncbi:hypothetical protein HPB52_011109 [Rhipicephalus sanguineus]|uniref:CCHC-type domain-containing protein n=1 Tax=Rhipicephalus sanguineus TaxID=34632 RepID=A0A9D4QDC3_RHISA|nr:hypothetical protein HPB52_011109 [Rhipicephalus sanguineus]